MKKTIADYPELISQWHPTKNGSLRPNMVSYGSKKMIWWKCSIVNDHEWLSTPNSRTSGQGCSCCAGKVVVSSNSLATVRPDLINEWHPTKNGTLTPYDVTEGSNKKIWWKCPIANDHEWYTSVCERKKSGCPCCTGQKIVLSNCLATTHPELSKQWHSKNKNNPLEVIAGSHQKVWWKCELEHEWKAEVKSRAYGKQCPYCTNRLVNKDNCLATTHPELTKQWHPTKNGLLNPYNITAGSGQIVWWKCPVANDHEWKDSLGHRTNIIDPRGCACCAGRKVVKSNCLTTTHPQMLKQWSKNNVILPTELTYGSYKKIKWVCKKGHEWEASVKSICRGTGCPTCQESKGEKYVDTVLKLLNVKYDREYRFSDCKFKRSLPFDFAVHINGQICLIEFHGEQHYFPNAFGSKKLNAARNNFKSLVVRDKIKLNYCKQNNYPILVIPYWETNIDKVVEEFVIKCKNLVAENS